VLSSLGISETLSKTEIYHIYLVLFFIDSNQEVVRFDVSMKEVIIVQKFHSLDHLVSNHGNSLQRELSLAKSEEVLQT